MAHHQGAPLTLHCVNSTHGAGQCTASEATEGLFINKKFCMNFSREMDFGFYQIVTGVPNVSKFKKHCLLGLGIEPLLERCLPGPFPSPVIPQVTYREAQSGPGLKSQYQVKERGKSSC